MCQWGVLGRDLRDRVFYVGGGTAFFTYVYAFFTRALRVYSHTTFLTLITRLCRHRVFFTLITRFLHVHLNLDRHGEEV